MADGGATGGHPNVGNPGNPRCFMDLAIGKRGIGRIVFELFQDFTPRTAENFRCLCTGERGQSPTSGTPLAFKDSLFHRIIPNFMAQGGDFTRGDGTGGESIFGAKFADENFILTHDGAGLLSMANSGANTNGSQFFLTFGKTPHLDGRHVVFGRVESGMGVIGLVSKVATDSNDKPRFDVVVTGCGEIGGAGLKSNSSLGLGSSSSVDHLLDGDDESGTRSGGGGPEVEQDDEDDEEEEVDEEAEAARQQEGMSEAQKRLFKLRMKINKGRKANRAAAGEEKKRLDDPYFESKQRAAERKAKKESWAAEMASKGLTTDQSYLFETQESANGKHERKKAKDKGAASFGWDVFNTDTLHKAYERRLESLPRDAAESDKKDPALDDAMRYGQADARPSQGALDRMAGELQAKADRNKQFSRRRAEVEGADVDHINARNAVFNKKIKRAYDKYTIETRQNLERGTALN